MSVDPAISGDVGHLDTLAPLHALEERGVPYCLWRGTRRMKKALEGQSDLDILVDPRAQCELAIAFAEARGRPAATGTTWTRPGLEDYFALASPSGPLLHYHIHYRLVAGESRLNRFTLPWDREVLETRTRHEEGGVFVAAPQVEAALLLIRVALQLSWFERRPGGRAGRLREKVVGDLAHLVAASSEEATRALVTKWLGVAAAATLPSRLVEVGIGDLVSLRKAAIPELRAYATRSGLSAWVSTELRALRAGMRKLNHRGPRKPWLLARGGRAGGILVVVAGGSADARSELADGLAAVFRSKFDVIHESGDPIRMRKAASRGFLSLCTVASAPTTESSTLSEVVLDLGAAPDTAREASGTWRGLEGVEDPLAHALEILWARM